MYELAWVVVAEAKDKPRKPPLFRESNIHFIIMTRLVANMRGNFATIGFAEL
jgi:hypothetical protein